MSSMHIRPFQPADEDAVIALWQTCGLVVPQNNPRRDIARELMQHAEALLRAAGCPKINLQVRSTNTALITFYESIGFAVDNVVSLGKRLEHDTPAS